ncbi:hypothetical protein FCG67_03355 [Rhodococcus oryzae]|uniref:HNH endonuclease n=1 Tax=Rhodococcus oryzae TaxID=2571143 RepID=A0ABY2RRH1_9NOCA|nr:hypothetical protein [Rhodococcus oryzae]TJZ81662.1 hypothetical protein FCG67_03355 [Rhodococcus oryzae]
MRSRLTAEWVLAEHSAALDRIRVGIAAANLAAEARSRQLCSAAVDSPAAETEPADGYPVSWLV